MVFGVPELHSMPVLLATRTRVAQRKGGAGVAAPPRQHLLSFFAAGPIKGCRNLLSRRRKGQEPKDLMQTYKDRSSPSQVKVGH